MIVSKTYNLWLWKQINFYDDKVRFGTEMAMAGAKKY